MGRAVTDLGRRRRLVPLAPPAPTHPDPSVWERGLLAALARRLRADLAWLDPPAPLGHGFGPWAFGAEVRPVGGAELPDMWRGPLVLRLARGAVGLEAEAEAMDLSRQLRLATPVVLALVPVAPPAGGSPSLPGPATGAEDLHVLVATAPRGVPLPELIGFNLRRSDELLGGFAAHHAELHEASGVFAPVRAGGDAIPVVDPAAELDRFDDRHAERVAWLRDHRPAPGPQVLCHGTYQPMSSYGPGPDTWDAHGGPGAGLTAVNWCSPTWAEREQDVAFTLVAFWSAPYFAPNRSERTAIKMIRNTLSNGYRLAYADSAEGELDADRMRYWQAFHALRGIARLAGGYDSAGSPFETADRGPLPDELLPQLERLWAMVAR